MKLITHIILAIAFCFVGVVSVSASQESDSLISTNVDYLKRNIERKIAKYEAKLEEYKNLLSELEDDEDVVYLMKKIKTKYKIEHTYDT